MPRELRYTDQALTDLDAMQRWQTQPGSGSAAVRRVQAIRAAINRLCEHPCLFPVGKRPGVRELPCAGGHRVMYQVMPDTGRDETAGNVRVLRVLGPGQSRDRL